jgi:hypothetical protein
MDGNRRIGPSVSPLNSGIECSAVYGFSQKGLYDNFCSHSQLELKPYPLVKGYLRNQDGAAGNDLKLVVVDAAGPDEPYLYAATMALVLEAQEKRTHEVTTEYRLIFDREANAYRVEENPG